MSGQDGARVNDAGGDAAENDEPTGDALKVAHGSGEDCDGEAVRAGSPSPTP